MQSRNILGVRVDDVTLDEVVALIEEWAHEKDSLSRLVVTANPEYIMAARSNASFRELVNSAALVTPDGVGLLYAGKLLRQPFRSRVTGVALVHALAKCSAESDLSLFLLGAAEGVAEAAAESLRKQYPGVKIAGCFAGNAASDGDFETLTKVRRAQPHIVLVAYGMVKQDYWAARNLSKSGAALSIGVGGVFDYISGRTRLAPLWVRRAGLEWLYRLGREPKRWRRILEAVPFFGAVVLLEAARQRLR
ncbi:MAG: WecB/TagA/CpsF family glycosyltransferase [Chloroflexi bacterium]|uniref:WecB/TagA/CpsF family glycosyltransferase n=1 Tax=Candidatus Chlorohelix allophototropha TaxID=3003348 RepID=A0A8T7LSU6_9CHLR|nr:WecB/TagA/CpsF family glycosyltransferase [Chloroflexota bacterium]WJW66974.1 WecB/TagA/CpsF family glycosyltransferase [Chloroflexota bacterium L227-S17]